MIPRFIFPSIIGRNESSGRTDDSSELFNITKCVKDVLGLRNHRDARDGDRDLKKTKNNLPHAKLSCNEH